MKTSFFFHLLTLIIVFSLFSFIHDSKPYPEELNIKEIDKSLAQISDSLYAGKFEVSNMLYLTFEKSLIADKKNELLKIIQVDSVNWRDKLAYNEPYVIYYYRHPSYGNYPVVNISYDAANLFCKWLTEKYNATPNRKFKKVLFRLPTEKEWEYAARAGWKTSFPWGYGLWGKEGQMCNYYKIGDEHIKYDSVTQKYFFDFKNPGSCNDAGYITAPVDHYSANDFGLFNVCGNVAEMIEKKGISCGGGWKSPGGDVTLASRAYYNSTANDLGFRYFMDVIEK